MLGAIAGDIIGSVYERHNLKRTDFPLFNERCTFTDDTVLTVATADAILSGADYGSKYKEWARRYPQRGYGPGFHRWAYSDRQQPYYSKGNGSAMRVSPVGWAFSRLEEVLRGAKRSAEVTHDHPDGIKGAQALAAAVFLARTGATKEEIRGYVTGTVGYRLNRRLEDIRPTYRHDITCPRSVPEAITAFLESEGYEDAVRKAVSIGGDSDTIACMAGSIAEAFYGGVPEAIASKVFTILDVELAERVRTFCAIYSVPLRS